MIKLFTIFIFIVCYILSIFEILQDTNLIYTILWGIILYSYLKIVYFLLKLSYPQIYELPKNKLTKSKDIELTKKGKKNLRKLVSLHRSHSIILPYCIGLGITNYPVSSVDYKYPDVNILNLLFISSFNIGYEVAISKRLLNTYNFDIIRYVYLHEIGHIYNKHCESMWFDKILFSAGHIFKIWSLYRSRVKELQADYYYVQEYSRELPQKKYVNKLITKYFQKQEILLNTKSTGIFNTHPNEKIRLRNILTETLNYTSVLIN